MISHSGNGILSDCIDHTDIVDVESNIGYHCAAICPDLRGPGGQTTPPVDADSNDAKPRAHAHLGGRPELVSRYQ